MSSKLLDVHKDYIERLKKDFYNNPSIKEAELCRLECIKPQVEGLVFAFVEDKTGRSMHVMDTLNNERILL